VGLGIRDLLLGPAPVFCPCFLWDVNPASPGGSRSVFLHTMGWWIGLFVVTFWVFCESCFRFFCGSFLFLVRAFLWCLCVVVGFRVGCFFGRVPAAVEFFCIQGREGGALVFLPLSTFFFFLFFVGCFFFDALFCLPAFCGNVSGFSVLNVTSVSIFDASCFGFFFCPLS